MPRSFRAQTIVEFALITPFLLAMLFGIVEGGRLLFTYNEVTNASREGVRFAVSRGSKSSAPATETTIRSRVLATTTGLEEDLLTVSASWPDGTNDPGMRVLVEVAYEYEPIISMVLGTGAFTLESSSEMRLHY